MSTKKNTEKVGSFGLLLKPLLKRIKVVEPKVVPIHKVNSRRRIWEDYHPRNWSPTSGSPFAW